MDFRSKTFCFLLFTGLISFNLGKILDKNQNKLQCNDEESREILEMLQKVEKPKQFVKGIIVLTESDDIYPPLKNELLQKAAVFLPLHLTFKTNITDIYKNILILEHASFVKFVIHANSVGKIGNMLQQFISVFRNIDDITRSVGIALTVKEDVAKENVINEIYKSVGMLKRTEALQFLDYYLKPDGPPIAIFNSQSASNPNVETFLQDVYYSSRDDKYDYFRFSLDDKFQRIINCATDFVERKVSLDVEMYVEKNLREYFDSLKQPITIDLSEEVAGKIARSYNHLLQFSQFMSNCPSPRRFLKNLRSTFMSAALDEIFIETYFLPQNIDAIQFLFMTSDTKFDSALDKWTKPLMNIELQNPENLKQWYQKEDGGFLLSRNFETNCLVTSKGTKMQVRGVIVKLSEINTQYCRRRVNFLEIFAVEAILIDMDLDLSGREIQLAIMAPVWVVDGKVKINLNGMDGKNFMNNATDGVENGNKNGADGKAGLPGGPAGSFYGVANIIFNAKLLTILANGGDGGKGQNAGHGANGEDGKTLIDENKFNCLTQTVDGFKVLNYSSETNMKYFVHGQIGKRGGRGGNGGAPGLGGNAGSILLFDLSTNDAKSFVRTNATTGNTGCAGIGRYPGNGGKEGYPVKIFCETSIWNFYRSPTPTLHKIEIGHDVYARIGEPGTNGISLKMRQVPKNVSIVQTFAQTVNEYKLYIRPKLTKINDSESQLQSFYNSINSRQEITEHYDTLSLVQEFTGLELQSYDLEDRYHLIPSFTILQQRIHNYSIKANYNNEKCRLFQDIILGIEDRINDTLRNLNKKTGHTVMTDLHKGFEYLMNEVQELENLMKMNSQIETLNDTLNSLDDLTEEANHLIGDELQSAMRDLEETLDQEINTLLGEISDMKKVAKQNEKDLIESREKLKKMMGLKALFGVLKIGCILVGAINPALGLVATAGIVTLSVVESQLTQTNISAQVAEVPKSLKLLTTTFESYVKKEEPNKDAIIEFQISEMTKNVTTRGKSFIKNMRERIAEKFRKTDSKERLLNYQTHDRERINKIFHNEEKEISNDLANAVKKGDKANINDSKIKLNVLKYLKVNGEVLQTASDTFTNIMKDADKVSELDQALETSSDNLNRLYKIEEKIYDETEPLMKRMTDFVDQAYNNINDLNENQILISEWNVESTIQNVQRTISKTFEGFNVTDEITWTLEKLMSAFQKISKMHKNVLDFQQRKSVAKFTAMLHLTKYSKIMAQDHRLTSALIQLEMAIWYNKVNDIYKNWKFAFKQFSFPNGGDILKAIGWKDTVRKDIISVVDAIVSNVEKFRNFLKEDKDSNELLNNRAPRFLRGSCSSDKSSFLVWTKDDSEELINDILSGKATTVVAEAPTSKVNALKFNKVGILFTSKNPEIQGQLFEIMKTVRVNLTHHGDSHYRFNNRTYRINTNPTVMTFNYPKNCDEIMSLPSLTYKKIANGECMLSPFATWTIKLYVDNNKLPSLEKFKGQVDLELIGEGTVFENRQCNKECETTMMNNYKYAFDIYF